MNIILERIMITSANIGLQFNSDKYSSISLCKSIVEKKLIIIPRRTIYKMHTMGYYFYWFK